MNGTRQRVGSHERARGWLWASLIWLVGCGQTGPWNGSTQRPDYDSFAKSVYPVLLRDCAFSTQCHGSPDRFFQVYGPGRTRLDKKTMPDDPPTDAEIQRSYDRAVSMLASGKGPGDSLLLRKPLETSAGGQGHKGVDVFGRNVFASARDPNYVVLVKWATGQSTGSGSTP